MKPILLSALWCLALYGCSAETATMCPATKQPYAACSVDKQVSSYDEPQPGAIAIECFCTDGAWACTHNKPLPKDFSVAVLPDLSTVD